MTSVPELFTSQHKVSTKECFAAPLVEECVFGDALLLPTDLRGC